MKKSIYRIRNVKSINVEKVHEAVRDQQIVVGHDVAKIRNVVVLMTREEEVVCTIGWNHPTQTRELLELLTDLPVASLEVAMEPSGSYSDVFRYQLSLREIPVYKVSPKRSHDYREVYDGVASSHDAKSAALIASLHLQGRSDLWRGRSKEERILKAAVKGMDLYHDLYFLQLNRLEGLLATFWPEVTTILALQSASLQELLKHFGTPAAVAHQPSEAALLLRRVGRACLSQAKIDDVIQSAVGTLGDSATAAERDLIRLMASEARRASQKLKEAERRVEALVMEHEVASQLAPLVGKVTCAVFLSTVGDPRSYGSAAALVKSFGLNLKERSSGKHKGQLKITKRGSSMARKYLYFAVLRLIQHDQIVKAWYDRKVKRDGGVKMKALVALMRKLVKALFHLARGARFEANRLFDTRRLKLTDSASLCGCGAQQ